MTKMFTRPPKLGSLPGPRPPLPPRPVFGDDINVETTIHRQGW